MGCSLTGVFNGLGALYGGLECSAVHAPNTEGANGGRLPQGSSIQAAVQSQDQMVWPLCPSISRKDMWGSKPHMRCYKAYPKLVIMRSSSKMDRLQTFSSASAMLGKLEVRRGIFLKTSYSVCWSTGLVRKGHSSRKTKWHHKRDTWRNSNVYCWTGFAGNGLSHHQMTWLITKSHHHRRWLCIKDIHHFSVTKVWSSKLARKLAR